MTSVRTGRKDLMLTFRGAVDACDADLAGRRPGVDREHDP
jgi:hypothetical protein